MRSRFDAQLDILNNSLISMGALCENAIASAVKALLHNDMSLSKKAIETEVELDQMEKDIERLCLRLLLQHHPVAGDLRLISAALKMITDMERIGDQAADIAEIVAYVDLTDNINKVRIADMAKATIKMVTESIDAFVKRDLKVAEDVIDYDDVVDDLFNKIKDDAIALITENPEYGEQFVDIVMIAKYLERIGDHATNIAEWVVFSITGEHKEQ
ncbi:MAG: phosphate signaling complex protein PhoU [Clostridiales bacterium]|jgi:phosphate transport system protein|nr:phosphate signaling complex protein PhoU [Clostridiales bacterium]HZJ57634.1 phosphate signaling complex protein PhoU [Clostridia bacterium]